VVVAPAVRGGDIDGAVAVEPDRTQLRLPAPGKQRASRQQNRRGGAFAHADGERKWHRAEAGAPLGGHGVGAYAGADGARARLHLQHVHQSRAQRQGRPKAARAAGVAASRAGHTCGSDGLVSLGSKRMVTKLIAGWIVLPAL
jgi:hypothetical protein